MDALGFGASQSNIACQSVQDLQGHLHHFLAPKTSDTRAEHASISFELLSHTALYIAAEPEDGARAGADAGAELDPSSVTRTVMASDTVLNQPADDPALQRKVAQHIASAIGVVDHSTWTVREVSRGQQGWQFMHICKDSLQAWNRANAKNPERPVIASYSNGAGFDPINLSRPAFDCRGTLSITFSKSSRSIVINYEHTPLHRTVTQLVGQLIPVPIPVANGNNSQRTPKAKGTRQGEGEESTQKKRVPKAKRPPPAEGEESAQKKRTPKAKRPATEGESGEGSRKKRKKAVKAPEAAMAGGLDEGQGDDAQAQAQSQPVVERASSTGFLNVPPAEAERRRQTAIELLTGKGIDPATLSAEQFNIFANQAPNLQAASLEMLAKYGAERLRIVHPDEKEQAGSSHSTPARSQAANESPAPAPGPAPDTSAAATTTTNAATTTDTPAQKPKRKRTKSTGAPAEVPIGNGAVVSVEQDGELGTTESALKPKSAKFRKTRGKCDTCKQRQAQCTKEHPSCSTCVEAGVECIYLPPKPRRKSEKIEKSAETVVDDDDDGGAAEEPAEDVPVEDAPAEDVQNEDVQNEADDEDQSGQASAPELPVIHAVAPPLHQPVQDLDNEEFIPDPNILSGPVETQPFPAKVVESDSYFSSSHTGLNFPHMGSATATGNTSMPELTYPQAHTQAHAQAHTQAQENVHENVHGNVHENVQQQPASNLGYSLASGQPQPSHHVPNTIAVATPIQNQRRQSASATNRKSLPTGQARDTSHAPTPAAPSHTANWNISPPMGHVATVSPNMTQQQAPKRSKPRKSRADHEPHGQAAPSPTQPVSQPVSQSMPPQSMPPQSVPQVNQYQSPMTRSPYQSSAHVSARQVHRSQTNTPVATTARAPPKAPPTNPHQTTTSTSYGNPATSTSAAQYDPYPRYNKNGTEQYTEADNAAHSASRATYASTSYQGNASTTASASYPSATSYDYNRGAGTANPLAQALNGAAGYNAPSNSASTQWPASQTRSTQSNNSSAAYGVPATTATSTQAYNARASDGRSSAQNVAYNQPQPQTQSYDSYSSQQPNVSNQGQQNWYRFPAANNGNNNNGNNGNNHNSQTSYANNRQSGYGSHRPNAPAYSGQYGATDEHALYELLRNHGTNH